MSVNLLFCRRCEEAVGPSELCRPVDGFKVRAGAAELLLDLCVKQNNSLILFLLQGTACRRRQWHRLVRPRQDETGKLQNYSTSELLCFLIYILACDHLVIKHTKVNLFVVHQEILEEVFRELHKVKDEIIDGTFNLLLNTKEGP